MTFDIKEFLIENRAPLNEADTTTAFIAASISATLADGLRETSKAQNLLMHSTAGSRQKLVRAIQHLTDIIHKARRQAARLS